MSIIYILVIFLSPFIPLSQNNKTLDKFDYSNYKQLLNNHVNNKNVNYKSLVLEKEKLFTFTNRLGKISPDSNPAMFPTKEDKLAFWINAYNAYILKTIIDNYPVASIKDINFIGATIWLNKQLIGGEKISFKYLEDDIIRERFKDPRIHFAINCASASCPPLLNETYVPDKLDKQLDMSAIKFINDQDNFKVDENNKTIYISAIFDWYEDDFIDWLKLKKGIKDPVILDYIKIYYNGNIKSEWYDYDVEINDYDWSINEYKENIKVN